MLGSGLYGITHTIELARALIAGGTPVVQLRDKASNGRALLAMARELRTLTREAGVLFIVNDRLDVALLAEADGVHVGQDDLPIEDVRRVAAGVGRPDLIVGVSTHDLDQVRAAARAGADYIGFGPIFSTATKADALPPRGLERLAEAVHAFQGAVVAIGGITLASAPGIAAAGATLAAVIGDVVQATDRVAQARALHAALRSTPTDPL